MIGLLLVNLLILIITFALILVSSKVELRGICWLDIAVVHIGIETACHDGVIEICDSSTL